VQIAKDILEKLKISIGNLNILDGLKLTQHDDRAVFGSLKGVAQVYDRLLAWGRGIDGNIMNHPSIIAATNAIGQLGYLAKLEAVHMARAAGNTARAAVLSEQLAQIPANYATATDATFGGLLDKVNQGIDTIMNRIQEINGPGAKVGFSAAKELGSYMGAAPIAGQAMQVGADKLGSRDARANAETLAAEEIEAQAAMRRVQSQNAARNRSSSEPARPMPGRPAPQVRSARPAATSTTIPPVNPAAMTAAQRQMIAMRSANIHATHEAEESQHHDLQNLQMQQALRQVNMQQMQQVKKTIASAANLKTATIATGRAPAPVVPHAANDEHVNDNHAHDNPYAAQPPLPPGKGGITR
jgi:hypothetical protein